MFRPFFLSLKQKRMLHFRYKWIFLLVSAFMLLIFSCSSPTQELTTGDYFSRSETIQNEFSKVENHVAKVYSSAEYVTYNIPADSLLKKADLKNAKLDSYSKHPVTESTRGTATLIRRIQNKKILLSCYHIFNYPDTLIKYYQREDGTKTPFISHLSIKEKHRHFLKNNSGTSKVEIAAFDEKKDLALLITTTDINMMNSGFIRLKTASKNQMKTGKEVFVMGYPNGYKMVTSGLMSKPFIKRPDKIMIDASFNKGYSGAPFFVLSPDCQCFKLAGIVNSSASEEKNILVPELPSHQKKYNSRRAYKESTYVEVDERIKYGITFTSSLQTIKSFYQENQQALIKKGINLEGFFN